MSASINHINRSMLLLLFIALPLLATAQIDLEDTVVEPMRHSSDRSGENRVSWFQANNLYGFKNMMTDQVLIPPEYESIDLSYSDFMVATKNGKTGVINKKGETVVPFEFQRIKPSGSNPASRFPWLLAAKNGLWGLIDPAGHLFEPFEWTVANYYDQKDSLVLMSRPGLQRLINRQGETVIETHFDRWETSGRIDRKKFICAFQNGKAGIVDFQQNVVLPFEFENLLWMEGTVVCISQNNRNGLVNLAGRPILPAEYGYIHPKYGLGLFGVNTPDAKKQGLVDSTGVFILPIEYARVYMIAGNTLIAAQNMDAKIAVFDLRGKQLTDFLFTAVHSRDDVPGLFFGQIEHQQYRLLNGRGEFLSPETFESISTSPTAFTATVGWKHAFFRLDGKQVTAFKYGGASGFDSLINRDRMTGGSRFPKGKTWIGRAYHNGKDLYIDSDGTEFDPLGN